VLCGAKLSQKNEKRKFLLFFVPFFSFLSSSVKKGTERTGAELRKPFLFLSSLAKKGTERRQR
jgi:hypothetical protein